ncbi:16S rRNA processing protein RimM [Clostridium carboxidivorans P7]|uniref:Ribosome maturation factor RimM n=1 Tax=Clostridium carboxidivorans P7 TaxID=536227 RepID=C6PQZ7_9CLOT|nr:MULTISPECIES: ribosome maturation factor RimM [Clostridium]AKN29445.1 16S rRNA processing protein RimM [Clostridium carboxidivorans P7]EET88361.1 16S rRNA processing protein RimM [Clostridium carboxidivorans P7]EFG89635.1 16S rRNA processing protein RimM [Clostridium carboxidivorans P7]WPC40707.1 ribosome maturation factor RimM [Clostridium sp. JS66]
MKQFVTVGQIINTHGIKGELKIYPLTDDLRRFRKLQKVYVEGVEKNVVWCKLQTDKVILKIEGIDSVEEAMKYKEKYLDVSREDAVKLPEGSYFIADIIGCSVVGENGAEYGKIADVIKTGSNDVYWIKEGKELLIPALKDIVIDMDIENKRIVIKPVETWQ